MAWQGLAHGRIGIGTVGAIVALLIPVVISSAYWQLLLAQAGIYIIAALGLNLLSGYAGLISIAQGGLMGVGGYACAILTVNHGMNVWLAVLVSIVITAGCGALLSLPALRLSTWYFAVVTLIFAEVIQQLLIQMTSLTNGEAGIVGVPPLTIGGTVLEGRTFLWAVIVIGILGFLAIKRAIGSRFGRAVIALRDNDAAATVSGIKMSRTRLGVFVASAGFAGLAGALFAIQTSVITPDDFGIDLSIYLLVVVVLGGSGTLWGPVVGGLVFFVVPEVLSGLSTWRTAIYAGALLVVVTVAPGGLTKIIRNLAQRLLGERLAGHASRTRSAAAGRRPPQQNGRGTDLTVRGVGKAFGGITALDQIELEAGAGTVHAIVGPNGSGKTTLLNVVCGFYRPDRGVVQLGGQRTSGMAPAAIARAGIGRTFQTPRLLPDLTAVDNVLLGAYGNTRASLIGTITGWPRTRAAEDAAYADAEALISRVGLAERSQRLADELTHGEQRLIEIARALVAMPTVLLLDEPAAGLALSELQGLANLLRWIRSTGTTVIVVEHHLDLVREIADVVTVLDRGAVLRSGSSDEVFADERVRLAYMGRSA